MTTYTYARVSTSDQDNANQQHGMAEYAQAHGWVIDDQRADSASGRTPWQQREIAAILGSAKKGDRLLVAEFSRLARSTIQVLEIVAEAAKIGLEIHVVKSSTVIDGSMSSKIICTVMALAAEIERDFIAARTTEALAVRREKGLPMGRPPGEQKTLPLDGIAEDLDKWHSMDLGMRQIARLAEVAPGTLYKWAARRRPDWIKQQPQKETTK